MSSLADPRFTSCHRSTTSSSSATKVKLPQSPAAGKRVVVVVPASRSTIGFRQMALADLVPDPATDPVFMAAVRASVIAGDDVPWSDRLEAARKAADAPEPISAAGAAVAR